MRLERFVFVIAQDEDDSPEGKFTTTGTPTSTPKPPSAFFSTLIETDKANNDEGHKLVYASGSGSDYAISGNNLQAEGHLSSPPESTSNKNTVDVFMVSKA